MSRPPAYNKVTLANDVVYGSYSFISGRWMGALFAKKDLFDSDLIAPYIGRIYTYEQSESKPNQHYMMKARLVSDRRRRVVIDGNPSLYTNIAGLANYAEGKSANARFVDEASESDCENDTNVVLRAVGLIPRGVEIRVDYDAGSSKFPFRDQLLEQGVAISALRSSQYRSIVWDDPPTMKPSPLSPNKLHSRPRGRPPKNSTFDYNLGKYVSTR